jgi:hypothetical protein
MGRGANLASADTSPGNNSRGHLEDENVPKGMDALSPAPLDDLVV